MSKEIKPIVVELQAIAGFLTEASQEITKCHPGMNGPTIRVITKIVDDLRNRLTTATNKLRELDIDVKKDHQ